MTFGNKNDDSTQNRGPVPAEEPIKKWRLTFGRERYPTVPIIVRKTEEPGEKPETDRGDSAR
jgi:hypothetical protein